jgi:L-alanine-DL-glutamate epimerase-like enolase superfamily enzyme
MIPVKYDRFPEYIELRTFLREHKLATLIADGENARSPDQFRDWAAQKAVDILQGDMNQFGFEDVLAMARLAETSGARIAPHNWGSLVGYYLQLQVGRSVPNFYRAEQDPMSSPALTPEGYTVKDGLAAVPDAPGLSLRINEKEFAGATKVLFDLKA